MGLLNTTIFESSVSFSGVQKYAANDDDQSIRASVAFEGDDFVAEDRSSLSVLVPLAGIRLLGLLHRTPQYAQPVAEALGRAGEALMSDGCDPARFRMRDVVETDTESLAMSVGMGVAPIALAELNGAIPTVDPSAEGSVEKHTRIRLVARRRGGGVRASFKFPMRSANPLITAGALFATVEHMARVADFKTVTQPAAAGLIIVERMSEGMSRHTGLPPAQEQLATSLLSVTMLQNDPVATVTEAQNATDEQKSESIEETAKRLEWESPEE